MSSSGGAICVGCKITRATEDLLAVRDRASGKVRFVCRPSGRMVPGKQVSCFTLEVRSREKDEVMLATDLPRPAAEPKAGRRGQFDVAAYHPTHLGMAENAA